MFSDLRWTEELDVADLLWRLRSRVRALVGRVVRLVLHHAEVAVVEGVRGGVVEGVGVPVRRVEGRDAHGDQRAVLASLWVWVLVPALIFSSGRGVFRAVLLLHAYGAVALVDVLRELGQVWLGERGPRGRHLLLARGLLEILLGLPCELLEILAASSLLDRRVAAEHCRTGDVVGIDQVALLELLQLLQVLLELPLRHVRLLVVYGVCGVVVLVQVSGHGPLSMRPSARLPHWEMVGAIVRHDAGLRGREYVDGLGVLAHQVLGMLLAELGDVAKRKLLSCWPLWLGTSALTRLALSPEGQEAGDALIIEFSGEDHLVLDTPAYHWPRLLVMDRHRLALADEPLG